MRTRFTCMTCAQERLDQGIDDSSPDPALEIEVVLTDTQVATGECRSGHRIQLLSQDPPYVPLFERSIRWLATGVTRDCTVDAYTALEMYMAHIPRRAHFEMYDGSPREIASRLVVVRTAERIIGAAALALSLTKRDRPVPVIPEWATKLRNDAVHGGRYPDSRTCEKLLDTIEKFIGDVEGFFAKSPAYWTNVMIEASEAVPPEANTRRVSKVVNNLFSPWVGKSEKVSTRLARYRKVAEERPAWWLMDQAYPII